jgi:hypothetical protein
LVLVVLLLEVTLQVFKVPHLHSDLHHRLPLQLIYWQ